MLASEIFPRSAIVDDPDNSPNRKLILIHPDDCSDILKFRNSNNRTIRRNVVTRIQADIISDRFCATHQALSFDTKGMLQDGQHRLQAVALAKKSTKCWVHFNQPPEYFKVLDAGTARLVSDNLSHYGVPRPTIVAPGLKNVLLYRRHPDRTWSNLRMPTTSEVFEAYSADSSFIDLISETCAEANGKFRPINKTGLFAACLLIAEKGYSTSEILGFCGHLINGANLSETSPILAYRNYLTGSSVKTKSQVHHQQFSLNCIIKVWNYSQRNAPLKLFKPMDFPPMLAVDTPPIKNTQAIPLSIRHKVFVRDNYTCQDCGAKASDSVQLEIDHKTPRSKGGSNDISNLRVLCSDCNKGKSDSL